MKRTVAEIYKKSVEENWSREDLKSELIKEGHIVKKDDPTWKTYQPFFEFMRQEHGLILTVDQMQEIKIEAEKIDSK